MKSQKWSDFSIHFHIHSSFDRNSPLAWSILKLGICSNNIQIQLSPYISRGSSRSWFSSCSSTTCFMQGSAVSVETVDEVYFEITGHISSKLSRKICLLTASPISPRLLNFRINLRITIKSSSDIFKILAYQNCTFL